MEEQVKNAALDLTKLPEGEFEPIMRGFKKFCDKDNDVTKYFGYVDKTDLKVLNRAFKYTDGLSFAKGAVAGLGIAGLVTGIVTAVAKEK